MECKLAKQPTHTGFYIYKYTYTHTDTHIYVLLSQTKERTPVGLNSGPFIMSIYKCSPLPWPILMGRNSLAIFIFSMPAFPHPLSECYLQRKDKASAILFRPVSQCRSSQQSVETIARANLTAQILTHE